jgi:hypothetical protein
MHRGFCSTSTVVLLLASAVLAQIRYFPPDVPPVWYEKDLEALKEPSLWQLSKVEKVQSYRFLWLRSFHNPIAVRITVSADGASLLTWKVASGATGRAGNLIQNKTLTLDGKQTNLFLEQVERSNFWKLPPVLEDRGVDGAQWIIEGVRDGDYHIVDGWSPKDGEVRALGMYMAKNLAKIKLDHSEIY